MKHLHKEESLYKVYQNFDSYAEPSVIKVLEPEQIIYSLDSILDNPKFKNQEYLSLYALFTGSLTIRINGTLGSGEYIAYSIDDGEWITISSSTYGISVDRGQTVRFKGNRTSYCPSGSNSTFSFSNYFILFGNINSLAEDPVFGVPSGKKYNQRQFAYLFYNNNMLLSIKNLKIPNQTDSSSLYYMFGYCRNLKDVMDWPLYLKGQNAANDMFFRCSTLKKADNLTLNVYPDNNVCAYMFRYCTNLVTVPVINEMQESESATQAYYYMFADCTSLKFVDEDYLPGLIKGQSAYSYMFYNCTSLQNIPRIKGLVDYDYLCQYMFAYCRSLEYLPSDYFDDITDISIASNRGIFAGMFNNCTNLQGIPRLPMIARYNKNIFSGMFNDCPNISGPVIIRSISGPITSIFNSAKNPFIVSFVQYNYGSIDSSNTTVGYSSNSNIGSVYFLAQGTDIPISVAEDRYVQIYTLNNTTLIPSNTENCTIINNFTLYPPPVEEYVTLSSNAQTLWNYCKEHPCWLYNATDNTFGFITQREDASGLNCYRINIGNEELIVAQEKSNLNSFYVYKNYQDSNYNLNERKAAGEELLQSWLSKEIYIFDKNAYGNCFKSN